MIQWWIKCECQLESGTKFTVLKAVMRYGWISE